MVDNFEEKKHKHVTIIRLFNLETQQSFQTEFCCLIMKQQMVTTNYEEN